MLRSKNSRPLWCGEKRTLPAERRLLDLQDSFILPEPCENSDPCWFGFLITCKEGCDRNKVVRYAEEQGVQTRMLFSEI